MAAKPIVAGTDGSEESLRAVDWAAREAPAAHHCGSWPLPRHRPE